MRHVTLILAAACAAAPLAAQHDSAASRPGMMHGMMQHEMGQMPMHDGSMLFAPQHLLDRRDKLALSSQQIARLETLRDAARTAHDRAATAARVAGDSLHAALAAAAPDTTLARRLFRAHYDAMGEAHWVMVKTAAQAKAVLTDAQRGRVDGWADGMHEGRH